MSPEDAKYASESGSLLRYVNEGQVYQGLIFELESGAAWFVDEAKKFRGWVRLEDLSFTQKSSAPTQ